MQLPRVKNQIMIRKRNGESFVVNLQSGEIYTLNETAIRILELCKEGASFDDATNRVSEEFEGNPQKVREDITSTIKTFRKCGFLDERTPRP